MPASPRRRSYKEVRLQQLRSFCETARLGSLAGAAGALGLAQPTVWEQVHALEREFDARLVEPYGRGCRLTEAGRVLAHLAAPLVAGIDSLKRQFQSTHRQVETRLTLATTQRVLVEDLPAPLRAFQKRCPLVRLCFRESAGDDIAAAVASGEADLGLSTERPSDPPNPWLGSEPIYELEPLLITPKTHPLARRRTVRPQDLRGYPLLNKPTGFADRALEAALAKLGVFRDELQRVQASHTTVIRRYVEAGFGIGIVPGLPGSVRSSRLHERSLRQHFGTVAVNLFWRKGAVEEEHLRALADTITTALFRPGRTEGESAERPGRRR